MFKKNSVIEIDNKYVYLNNIHKNTKKDLERKIIGNINFTKSLEISLEKRKVHLILDGKKIFVKLITIPKVRKSYIDKIVRKEVEYYFKEIDNLIYSYRINKEEKELIEILVFCLNWREIDILKNIKCKDNIIKGVWLIQFCILEYFKKSFTDERFILTFIYNDNLYFIACNNDNLISNNIINDFNEDNFFSNLKEFIKECNEEINEGEFKVIYFVNFKNKKILETCSSTYNCKDLGTLSRDDIVKKFITMR
ncbi:hypothetical protein BD780_002218 [Clostridium tetanomorphum]|uniref:Uncharacterized protein n=1 Tax=Clostridium tetanomorphum TaxID=1553 RepID=A0A923E523_CLOTT|nr:hypothetical protein [Clostridium tetanomorphum]KAJ51494.1 hypothetical protein CTM_12930 [Clostridium tetanomorphum DSM 665]MBC2396587.1 hypothetical protein [Clostridium tetanomorphum]MBP1863915.1 hypothetical protein [Clostridium tetanomorphum]NRS84993.1 hypothetical protein [Clostridium tetanomorphum]NRZ98209.1 hypothetical protein [Clostridium tetanomorphum]